MNIAAHKKRTVNGVLLKPGLYYGRTERRRQFPRILLTEVTYPSGHFTPSHIHEYAYFSYVLRGVTSPPQECQFQKTLSLVFHPAGSLHHEEVRPCGGRSLYTEITPALLDEAKGQLPTLSQVAVLNPRAGRIAATLYHEFQLHDTASAIAVEGLVLQLLAEAVRHRDRKSTFAAPNWLRRVTEILADEYPERLRLSAIASDVGVHPVYLATQFRRYYRCSIGDYVRRLKIEKACALLASADISLSAIAAEVGFSDQAHFTRTFKAYLGTTPSTYRKLRA